MVLVQASADKWCLCSYVTKMPGGLLKRPTMSHVQIKMELKEGAKAAASLEAGKNVGPPFAGSFKEVEGGTHAIGAK